MMRPGMARESGVTKRGEMCQNDYAKHIWNNTNDIKKSTGNMQWEVAQVRTAKDGAVFFCKWVSPPSNRIRDLRWSVKGD